MRRQIILSLSALALASTAAQAREERWYVSLEAGASFAQDADFDFGPIGGPVAGTGTAELETGWAGMAALGYAWPKNWRAEFELGYRNNDLDRVCIPGCAAVPGGSVEAFSQMFNVIYDFDIAQDWYLSLGAGIGGNYVTIEGAGASDNDYALAGQLLAGINYEISDRLDLSLNYRYMYVGDLEFSNAGLGLFADVDGLDYHAVTVGLRWDLHPKTVEAVVVVKDPVPPAKQYIVFFGFNKFNLTAEAQGVVAEAASAAKAQGTANILITGHADTSGTNAYNIGLSERRAFAVKDELVRLGTTAQILTTAKGETELLVQTADGVREPQNRRATIDLQ